MESNTQNTELTGFNKGDFQDGIPRKVLVEGRLIDQLPEDLYIPPDALRVFLDAFEGPLDLLLYLIKKQNLNILDINISQITSQYVEYVELMEEIHFELAAEYLVMAAMLAEIKSRMLLPTIGVVDDIEDDPRADLIRRLQEYEQFKTISVKLDSLPRVDRDLFIPQPDLPLYNEKNSLPHVSMQDLMYAMSSVLDRAKMFESHHIKRELLSTRERMTHVLERLNNDNFLPFAALFDPKEGKLGVVVTFLAIMELNKETLIDIVQSESFAPIYVKTRVI